MATIRRNLWAKAALAALALVSLSACKPPFIAGHAGSPSPLTEVHFGTSNVESADFYTFDFGAIPRNVRTLTTTDRQAIDSALESLSLIPSPENATVPSDLDEQRCTAVRFHLRDGETFEVVHCPGTLNGAGAVTLWPSGSVTEQNTVQPLYFDDTNWAVGDPADVPQGGAS